MTDEETLDVVRRLVAERGQAGAGKALGVARSLLSMVMSGSTPVSAKLRERVSAYLRQGAVDGVAYAEWQRPGDDLPAFVEVWVGMRFEWLDKEEAEKLAQAVTNYAFLYIQDYADRRLPDGEFYIGAPPVPPKPDFP